MVRLIHLSDTHLGHKEKNGVRDGWAVELRSRWVEDDFYKQFQRVFDKIIEMKDKFDIVIHSVDLFDSPWERNPYPVSEVAREIAFDTFEKYFDKVGKPLVIIEGNHGLYKGLDTSILNSFKYAFPDIYVATYVDLKNAIKYNKPLKFEFDTFEVFAFPYVSHDTLMNARLKERYDQWIITYQKPGEKTSIAVAHGMDLDKTLPPKIKDMKYDYIALGHDHSMHKYTTNAYYAGSIERWRFDEYRHEKGILLVEAEKGKPPNVEKIIIPTQRPMYVKDIEITSKDIAENIQIRIEQILKQLKLNTPFDPKTAARLKIKITGKTNLSRSWEIEGRLSYYITDILKSSEYNIIQFTWDYDVIKEDLGIITNPYEDSDYLLEDPKREVEEFISEMEVPDEYKREYLVELVSDALTKTLEDGGENN